jgi:glycerol-3-phosphate acyltransferase PlsX
MSVRIAVDAMGGDDAPRAIVPGAVAAARTGAIEVVLVGDRDRIHALLPRRSPIVIVAADQVVGMSESAVAGVRRKADSSIRRTVQLVMRGEAAGAVSCGHTGAVLVASVIELGLLEGVDRPAVATVLPRSDGGRLVLLDAGANVDCRPEQLACFALLGAAYAEVLGVRDPRIGLLSNGEEDGKGNLQVRASLSLLRSLPIRVVGNIEPTAAMSGGCDVLVCDGFVGNILLKAAEGAVDTVVRLLREEIRRTPAGMLGALLLRGAFRRFRARVAWDAHGGALLLGTEGVVVVGHGRANPHAVAQAIRLAARAAEGRLVPAVAARLGQLSLPGGTGTI